MASQVIRIAEQNGDQSYVLVDKAQGQIGLFQNGKPIFVHAALTGESMADQLPPDAMSKNSAQHIGLKYKVTPAGRFTLSRGHDDALGQTLDINELQAMDWAIAIHQVWLGIRTQRRDLRLRSSNLQDKHITEGCIDVDPGTLAQLLRLLPAGGSTPIYILPTDESLMKTLFHAPASAGAARIPTG
jgi:hypothetical protein